MSTEYFKRILGTFHEAYLCEICRGGAVALFDYDRSEAAGAI